MPITYAARRKAVVCTAIWPGMMVMMTCGQDLVDNEGRGKLEAFGKYLKRVGGAMLAYPAA